MFPDPRIFKFILHYLYYLHLFLEKLNFFILQEVIFENKYSFDA